MRILLILLILITGIQALLGIGHHLNTPGG